MRLRPVYDLNKGGAALDGRRTPVSAGWTSWSLRKVAKQVARSFLPNNGDTEDLVNIRRS